MRVRFPLPAPGRALLTGAMLALVTPAAAAPPAADPAALVRRLYANVAADQPSGDPLWWGVLTGRAKSLMQRVVKAEQASGDELIDADFLCQCQDATGIHITSLTITKSSPTRAAAAVRFTYGDRSANSVRLDLVNESGWKILEMTNKQGETLTGELQDALKPYPGR